MPAASTDSFCIVPFSLSDILAPCCADDVTTANRVGCHAITESGQYGSCLCLAASFGNQNEKASQWPLTCISRRRTAVFMLLSRQCMPGLLELIPFCNEYTAFRVRGTRADVIPDYILISLDGRRSVFLHRKVLSVYDLKQS
jgi:hypothetical protein